MDYEGLNKYIQYVLAQVAEGGHTKEELRNDLYERGLTEEEINYVIEVSWQEGRQLEGNYRSNRFLKLCLNLLVPLLMVVLLLCDGLNIIEIHSFWILLGGVLGGIAFVLGKKRFKD